MHLYLLSILYNNDLNQKKCCPGIYSKIFQVNNNDLPTAIKTAVHEAVIQVGAPAFTRSAALVIWADTPFRIR